MKISCKKCGAANADIGSGYCDTCEPRINKLTTILDLIERLTNGEKDQFEVIHVMSGHRIPAPEFADRFPHQICIEKPSGFQMPGGSLFIVDPID